MKLKKHFLYAFLMVLFTVAICVGQTQTKPPGQWEITSESTSVKDGKEPLYCYEGNVEATWGDFRITADSLTITPRDKKIKAVGNVVLWKNSQSINVSSLEFFYGADGPIISLKF